jgi:hypothetical protein
VKPSTARVLQLLRERGDFGLTSLDALANGGGSRLAARIADLKAEGYRIDSDLVTVPTRNAPARVSRYVIREAPVQLTLEVA